MRHILKLTDITIRYGTHIAVDSLCLHIRPGECYGLLGPNGCGKSSTLAAISGNLAPSVGEVLVAQKRECDDPLAYRRLIGLVPQELALYDELSVWQNVAFFARLYGMRGAHLRRRIDEVLDFVRLKEHAQRIARTLSGGQQRRLNLACALTHDPALLLLDEPTVALDIQSRDAIFANIRELCNLGTSIVFTTHHLEEAEILCDRVGIMDHGRLIAEGTVDELCASPMRRWRLDGPHRPARRNLEGVFLDLTGRSLREP